ncbi:hypothetical protein A9X61_04815 [Enterobacter asburiae]|nr:hypothetical protein A9X61_04815 [Enterobacter asburiae]
MDFPYSEHFIITFFYGCRSYLQAYNIGCLAELMLTEFFTVTLCCETGMECRTKVPEIGKSE